MTIPEPLFLLSAFFWGASIASEAIGRWVNDELVMAPLVVTALAPTELDCRRVPLRNGRPGESVLVCEGGLPPVE